MAPTRKARATAANRVTKSTQNATRQTSGRTAAAADAPSKAQTRKALAEKPTNIPEKPTRGRGSKRPATEDIAPAEDEQDEGSVVVDAKPKGGRGRPRAAKAPRISNDEDVSTAAQPEPAVRPAARRGRKPKAQVEVLPEEPEEPEEPEIPETQPVEQEIPETQTVESTELSLGEYDQTEDLPPHDHPAISSVQRIQSHNLFNTSRRAVAASDSELHEPSMRRRVGDLTRKYDNLEAKYRDLREIGIKEAERNYDRLKKQSEDRANTANQLISTLKAQLATQTELAKESQRLRQQLETSQSKLEQLQEQVSSCNASLSEAKAENKTLSTKLAAARSAESANAKVPSSAIKGPNANMRLNANAEAAAKIPQMKADLYRDMTGLIIQSVRQGQNTEMYNCIQTGRNGTLHFKLAVGVDDATEFDEPQFMYMPQLEIGRDHALMDILPDYLLEEITFPQSHAERFYSRVMKALNERLE
ncbi:chromosome segregation protein Csm1/Pcs1-domain-containing protein [Hypoxylon rubiginosum]|uniref:Chromosome segregation protein Csm1/Pcs1-domain-containing protein n=1 Tax=Hypoxylon rubiginosum TaxID=110542 RepID=A0ACC0D5F2_9PEZI|nr:chromosome segregation protein Csm1/Pcs1-domain-containing protein [Hypoxylon rubiginosum]